jgi:hypothetical protein
MEDGTCQRVYLVTAIFALIALTAANTVVALVYNATVRTSGHVAISLLVQVVETRRIIRKAFIELFNRELHTTSV